MSEGGRKIESLSTDIDDWRITFVDTGLHSNIGQRLLRVRHLVQDEPAFLANYSDGLTDLPLDRHIEQFERTGVIASLASVHTAQSLHAIRSGPDGIVTVLGEVSKLDFRINAGFFCLKSSIFEYIHEGEELVEQPFQRLIARKALGVYPHDGFWKSMDTLKDKLSFDEMEAHDNCPWMVWRGRGV